MSDESEYSDGEFYYPGELSDVELLQSPTYSKTEYENNFIIGQFIQLIKLACSSLCYLHHTAKPANPGTFFV